MIPAPSQQLALQGKQSGSNNNRVKKCKYSKVSGKSTAKPSDNFSEGEECIMEVETMIFLMVVTKVSYFRSKKEIRSSRNRKAENLWILLILFCVAIGAGFLYEQTEWSKTHQNLSGVYENWTYTQSLHNMESRPDSLKFDLMAKSAIKSKVESEIVSAENLMYAAIGQISLLIILQRCGKFISTLIGVMMNNGKLQTKNKAIFVLLISSIVMVEPISTLTTKCEYSLLTLREVDSCPITKREWIQRSMMMNCSSMAENQNCTSNYGTFVYHCARNEWHDATVEVCAPYYYMLGHCPEFNVEGARIQNDYGSNCTSCGKYYRSDEVYKYKECFIIAKGDSGKVKDTSMTMDQSDDDNITPLVMVVVLVLIVITCILVIFCICWKIRRRQGVHCLNKGNFMPVIRRGANDAEQ